jgi:hypothetical protein
VVFGTVVDSSSEVKEESSLLTFDRGNLDVEDSSESLDELNKSLFCLFLFDFRTGDESEPMFNNSEWPVKVQSTPSDSETPERSLCEVVMVVL